MTDLTLFIIQEFLEENWPEWVCKRNNINLYRIEKTNYTQFYVRHNSNIETILNEIIQKFETRKISRVFKLWEL